MKTCFNSFFTPQSHIPADYGWNLNLGWPYFLFLVTGASQAFSGRWITGVPSLLTWESCRFCRWEAKGRGNWESRLLGVRSGFEEKLVARWYLRAFLKSFQNFLDMFDCLKWKIHADNNVFSFPAGSPYYDNVRPLSYPDSDAVLICFDISRPETLDSVLKKASV